MNAANDILGTLYIFHALFYNKILWYQNYYKHYWYINSFIGWIGFCENSYFSGSSEINSWFVKQVYTLLAIYVKIGA